MKDTFIFRREWYEAMKQLPADMQVEFMSIVFEYALNGTEPQDLSPYAAMCFAIIRNGIDSANDKYQETCAKRRLAGKRGGRPRKQAKSAEANGFDEKQTKQNNPDNDIQDTIVSMSISKNDNSTELSVIKDNPVSQSAGEVQKTEIENVDFASICTLWNEKTQGIFGTLRLPFGEKRKKMVKARIREYGMDEFRRAIEKCCESAFLKGQNKRGFMASFDWMIKPTSFERLISGNYDGAPSSTQSIKPSNNVNDFWD